MKQLVVISGKGGTGKTTITSVFATLAECVIADCDVDAPNLHILLKPEVKEALPFKGMKKATIIDEKCERCGLCMDLCRFDAIYFEDGQFVVDDVRCEGCGFCYRACPSQAIEMVSEERGKIFVSKTAYGDFVYALLEPGEENSGLLVSEVKKVAKKIAEESGVDLILIDGAPGIGCPVIASLSNVDLALIVTEPTLSGISDMERVLSLTKHFKVKSLVVVNKFDLNADMTKKIEEFCKEMDVEVIGKIPFYEDIPMRIANLQIPTKDEIVEVWRKLEVLL
jgi:MinD superfamily P-loop ATPase